MPKQIDDLRFETATFHAPDGDREVRMQIDRSCLSVWEYLAYEELVDLRDWLNKVLDDGTD